MAPSQRQREPISIDGFFSFLNELLKGVDSPATFKSWHFYKERILYSYGEDELRSELIPVSSFAEMLPGSRIFWIGCLEIRDVEVNTEIIFNVGADGQTRLEANYVRGVKGLSADEVRNKRVRQKVFRTSKAFSPIVIPLIGELIKVLI